MRCAPCIFINQDQRRGIIVVKDLFDCFSFLIKVTLFQVCCILTCNELSQELTENWQDYTLLTWDISSYLTKKEYWPYILKVNTFSTAIWTTNYHCDTLFNYIILGIEIILLKLYQKISCLLYLKACLVLKDWLNKFELPRSHVEANIDI